MLTIIYPGTINWFYKHQAELVAREFTHHGLAANSYSSDDIEGLSRRNGTLVVLSMWECITDADRSGCGAGLRAILSNFERRVLLNYDSLFTPYFRRHFTFGVDLVTEIIDVCLIRQTKLKTIYGRPYHWMPETFCVEEIARIEPWSAGRPLPWAMLGHANPARAALTAACIETLHPGGLLFMPPIRPYDAASALAREAIHRVLRQSDLYIWGSHHDYPYHEGLRALHAVAAGAIPCKIDPVHHSEMAQIPWIYPSLVAVHEARERRGLAKLYDEARTFLLSNATMGQHLIRALGLVAPVALPARPSASVSNPAPLIRSKVESR